MKALVLKHSGRPAQMVVEERATPVARPGFALVRMHAATVNPLSGQIHIASALRAINVFVAEGLLRPHIDSTFAFEQFEQAYARLESRQATGTILIHL
jgi:NADPH:quinone reductase-like Zn-dependent oxidoreductase